MIKFINYLISKYLNEYHDYKIHMDISKSRNMIIEFSPPFLLKSMYSKAKIDSIVRARLVRYYMDDVSNIRYACYINRATGRVDRYRSPFRNI